MRTSYKKNEKIIKIIYLIIIFLIFFIFIKNIDLNKNSKNLFIDSKSIISIINNNQTSIIYDYLFHRNKIYVIDYDNYLNYKKINYINNHFPSMKYMNKFMFYIYSIFNKDKIMFYTYDNNIIKNLKKRNIRYCKVALDINDITENEYLTLKHNNNAKIFLSFTNNNIKNINTNINYELRKYLVKLEKNLIYVIDGDTIKYKGNNYRFIGLDAPELKQSYGSNTRMYVINLINNANDVSILISSYDIFNRILCHIFIDNIPLAYYMIKDKQAKETITKYGDGGFNIIASNIVYLSKFQGRRPFVDPAKFKKTNN